MYIEIIFNVIIRKNVINLYDKYILMKNES